MRDKRPVTSDSSSEDEDMSKFAQAAVTVESLEKDQQVVASKGLLRQQGFKQHVRRPHSEVPAGPTAGDPAADGGASGTVATAPEEPDRPPGQGLEVWELKIAAALDRRLEVWLTQHCEQGPTSSSHATPVDNGQGKVAAAPAEKSNKQIKRERRQKEQEEAAAAAAATEEIDQNCTREDTEPPVEKKKKKEKKGDKETDKEAGAEPPAAPSELETDCQQPEGDGKKKKKKKNKKKSKLNSEGQPLLQQLDFASGEDSDAGEVVKTQLQESFGKEEPVHREEGDFVFFSRVKRGSLCNLKPHLENHFVEGVRAARGWKAIRLGEALPSVEVKLVLSALAVTGESLISEAPLVPTKKMAKARLPRPGLVMESSRMFVPHEERMKALLGSTSSTNTIAV